MILKILASGSSSNNYILKSSTGQSLIIETGLPLSAVSKALNFEISGIIGVCLSHCHQDHSKYTLEYLNAGIKVYASRGTIEAMNIKHHNFIPVPANFRFKADSFEIMGFNVSHDTPEPFGYLIKHQDSGLIAFATDTYNLPYTFSGLSHIIIEANYSNAILEENLQSGKSNQYLRDRVLNSHMELETLKQVLSNQDLSKVMSITLIHLSNSNSDAEMFKQEIISLTGKNVYIAVPGLIVPMDKTAF